MPQKSLEIGGENRSGQTLYYLFDQISPIPVLFGCLRHLCETNSDDQFSLNAIEITVIDH
jgi:hypothetical protein